ncbi:hypothetical protein ACEWY4_020481 [Coilia grayii]|uniref:C-type lectin domain-containing protein n=1 Tax=Coilia grayii TaxID=363190 RepID=A0ABD1JFW0_9TELE
MGCGGVLIVLLIAVAGARALIHYELMWPLANWTDAQKHCRKTFFDLVSLDRAELVDDFLGSPFFKKGAENADSPSTWEAAWIGLSRRHGSQEWVWSDTGDKLSNKNLEIRIPDEDKANNLCVVVNKFGDFYAKDCAEPFPFFCYHHIWRNYLVLTNMTWSHALSYCRERNGDMSSLLMDNQLQVARQRIQAAGRGDLAWIALRYVRRYWLWMNGDALEFQAWAGGQRPQCPAVGHYCGAVSSTMGHWVNLDCEQKLPFFCKC